MPSPKTFALLLCLLASYPWNSHAQCLLPDLQFGQFGARAYKSNFTYFSSPKIIPDSNSGFIYYFSNTPNTQGSYSSLIFRTDFNGKIDQSFGQSGYFYLNYFSSNGMKDLCITKDHIFILGSIDGEFQIYRLHSNGTIDNGFGNSGMRVFKFKNLISKKGEIHQLDSSGFIITCVMSASSYPWHNSGVTVFKIKYNGELDSTFGHNGVNTIIRARNKADDPEINEYLGSFVSKNEIIIAGGNSLISVGFSLVKFTKSGQVDSNFGINGISPFIFTPQEPILNYYFYSDGNGENRKYYFTGIENKSNYSVTIIRMNLFGNLDSSFGNSGRINIISKNGKTDYGSIIFRNNELIISGIVMSPGPEFTKKLFITCVPKNVKIETIEISDNEILGVSSVSYPTQSVLILGHTVLIPCDSLKNTSPSLLFPAIVKMHFNPLIISRNTITENTINVFPNPVNANSVLTLNLPTSLMGEENLLFTIIDSKGLIIYQEPIASSNSNIVQFVLPTQIPAGLFEITISNAAMHQKARIIVSD